MWFSTLASSLRPVRRTILLFNLGQRWGVSRKPLFDKPSQVAGTLYGRVDNLLNHKGAGTVSGLVKKLGSLPASAQTLYGGFHFPNAGKSFRDKVTGLGPNIQGCTDEFLQHARELYSSDKMIELKQSVDSIASTATNLYQVVKGAAEQRGIPLYSILQELGNTFSVLFEELKEQFPPPEEAPSREKRMTMTDTVLDRIEESFLHFAVKAGASEELLRSYTSSLKFGIKHVVVTIGDVGEQHPQLVQALSRIVFKMLLAEGLGPLGPMIGEIAVWLQRWLFGPAMPKGD